MSILNRLAIGVLVLVVLALAALALYLGILRLDDGLGRH